MIELHHGDCLEEMRKVPKGSVNMVLCDLPYGSTSCAWDVVIPFDELWAAYEYVLAPGGIVVLFGSQPFTSALIMSNLKWFRYELIWSKNRCGSPGLAKIRPMKTHENILVFSPGRSLYNPQMTVGEPYSRKSSRPEGYVGKANNHGYGMKPRTEFSNEGTRYPQSILNISRDFSAQQQMHPAQKPVPVLEWLIKTYTDEGMLVLDNTMGSGSTGVACKRIGRSFIGMEQDKAYYDIAVSRINQQDQ